MDALTFIEQETLGITTTMTNDEALAMYDRVLFYAKEMKRVKEQAETQVVEWIKKNGDLIVSPTVRYYVGAEKVTKCTNVPAAMEAILTVCEGDFTKFCGVLSSNAIKHGAASKLLPPKVYEQYFRVEIKEDLREGGAAKTLKRIDETWMPKRLPTPTPQNGVGSVPSGPAPSQNKPGMPTAMLDAAEGRDTSQPSPAPNKPADAPTRKDGVNAAPSQDGLQETGTSAGPNVPLPTPPAATAPTASPPARRGRP